MKHELRADLRFEPIDEEIVVLDASGGTVYSLAGDAADVVRALQAGGDVPEHLSGALEGLVEAGIVERPAGWSRRKALIAGGVGVATAATGFFSMALPAAAVASSCTNAGSDDVFGTAGDTLTDSMGMSTPRVFDMAGNFSFKTGGMVTMVTVQVWGGGGAGGNGGANMDTSGAGGGGGGFASATIDVVPCTVYTVVVGAGGPVAAGMPDGGNGGAGGSSSFSTVSATGGAGGMGSSTSGGGAGGVGVGGTTNTSGGMGGNGIQQPSALGAGGGGGGGGAGTTMNGGDGGNGMGGNSPGAGGAGGMFEGGMGGAGAYSTSGALPAAPGGGGGGGGSQNSGQPTAGASGRVTISLA